MKLKSNTLQMFQYSSEVYQNFLRKVLETLRSFLFFWWPQYHFLIKWFPTEKSLRDTFTAACDFYKVTYLNKKNKKYLPRFSSKSAMMSSVCRFGKSLHSFNSSSHSPQSLIFNLLKTTGYGN